MMFLYFDERYKLKKGQEPTHGSADYGTEDLQILAIDTNDFTLMVRPHGYSQRATFWAAMEDLELQN